MCIRSLMNNLSQINEELEKRTVEDLVSEDEGASSIQRAQTKNFDLISQSTQKSKSSFYNIKRLRQNLVQFNRKGTSLEGKKSRPKIQNAKKSSEFVNSMFPLL